MAALYEDLRKLGPRAFIHKYAHFAVDQIADRMKLWPSFSIDLEFDPNEVMQLSAANMADGVPRHHGLLLSLAQSAGQGLPDDAKPHERFHHQAHRIYDALNGVSRRKKSKSVKTPEDVVKLFREAKNVMIIAGAGISTSLGIPDFRSTSGIYNTINPSEYDLTEPQEIFDIRFFKQSPESFYKLSKVFLVNPTTIAPSPAHIFMKRVADHGKLLRVYTQNVDGIEHLAGVPADRVIQCHGTIETASCMTCGASTPIHGSWVEQSMAEGKVAWCPNCTGPSTKSSKGKRRRRRGRGRTGSSDDSDSSDVDSAYASGRSSGLRGRVGTGAGAGTAPVGLMKPDCTFFHEPLPANVFSTYTTTDHDAADLVIVIGSSLRVPPVNQLVHMVPPGVPRVLINRERLPHVDGAPPRAIRRRNSLVRDTGVGAPGSHTDTEVQDGEVDEVGTFDVELLGLCDEVVAWLTGKLGWNAEDVVARGSSGGSVDENAAAKVAAGAVGAAADGNVNHGPLGAGGDAGSGPTARFKPYKRVGARVFAFRGAKY